MIIEIKKLLGNMQIALFFNWKCKNNDFLKYIKKNFFFFIRQKNCNGINTFEN